MTVLKLHKTVAVLTLTQSCEIGLQQHSIRQGIHCMYCFYYNISTLHYLQQHYMLLRFTVSIHNQEVPVLTVVFARHGLYSRTIIITYQLDVCNLYLGGSTALYVCIYLCMYVCMYLFMYFYIYYLFTACSITSCNTTCFMIYTQYLHFCGFVYCFSTALSFTFCSSQLSL